MANTLRVATVQMNSKMQKSANLLDVRVFIEEASQRGCDLVAFPENFLVFSDSSLETRKAAESEKGVTLETLQEWAAENDIWILAGSFPILSKKSGTKKVTNSSFLISTEGEIKARYDKIHLFDVKVDGDREYKESTTIQAGKKPVLADTPWGKFGLSICYDLRFPELYRKLTEMGAELIFIPSAFTFKTGQAHWDTLTRARAIENQVFVVAPAQWGRHENGRETWGHSRVVNPWGKIIAEQLAGPGLVVADLDFDLLKEIRKNLPCLKHRVL